jgi:hypothetical protein
MGWSCCVILRGNISSYVLREEVQVQKPQSTESFSGTFELRHSRTRNRFANHSRAMFDSTGHKHWSRNRLRHIGD